MTLLSLLPPTRVLLGVEVAATSPSSFIASFPPLQDTASVPLFFQGFMSSLSFLTFPPSILLTISGGVNLDLVARLCSRGYDPSSVHSTMSLLDLICLWFLPSTLLVGADLVSLGLMECRLKEKGSWWIYLLVFISFSFVECLLFLFPRLGFPPSGLPLLELYFPHIWWWLFANNVFGIGSWVWCWCWVHRSTFSAPSQDTDCEVLALELRKLGLLLGEITVFFDVFYYFAWWTMEFLPFWHKKTAPHVCHCFHRYFFQINNWCVLNSCFV